MGEVGSGKAFICLSTSACSDLCQVVTPIGLSSGFADCSTPLFESLQPPRNSNDGAISQNPNRISLRYGICIWHNSRHVLQTCGLNDRMSRLRHPSHLLNLGDEFRKIQ